ncbi:pyridoxamine 5'-phosphate oxidase family protein [Halalkalibacter alkaliphilus]|uniref:Pyridoxamine 5'-phosphate oxidase family protein n=1 Tax=Halalkalibacter alkaliphilus TaxID=2917993 RepID=A0A9X2CPJ1_9BACI|nr:pyridoxamine 5'-phosphate oxidase family protein [Halalkalibacter alkaliphilus]MCL7746322.1 pyridoxamine 5'-phosphate oxidase family protein [Halalkalibacter alkaliphilus]
MANQVEYALTEEMLPLLQKECYVTIATIDYEKNIPYVKAISWVYAPNVQTIRIMIDNRSRIVENIKTNEGVVLTLIANGSTYSITGSAKIVTERIENLPLKLSMIEMEIQEVRDVMFYGAKMTITPSYEKTYDAEAAAKLDRQVMEALKKKE